MNFVEDVLVPIVPCPRCRQRFVVDPNRDGMCDSIPLLPGEEALQAPKCDECSREAFGEAWDADWQDAAKRLLGLTEEDKETLKALKYLVQNHSDRIYMVVRVHDRVDELERRLEDRAESIRTAVVAPLESANIRIFIAMLIVSVLTFLLGLTLGG